MKKLLLLALSALLLTSCAGSKFATKAGAKIGKTYQEAAALGTVSAEESIKAWPYISGQIKGLMADNYDIEVPMVAKKIIRTLDMLSKRESLTDEEKGYVIGSFCRLEEIAVREAWDRYGGKITGFFAKLVGAG